MTSHKCQLKQNKSYEIKQRYIPTFVHQPIFEQEPLRPYSSKCNPTFHSTVFDIEGYNIKTVHYKNKHNEAQTQLNSNKQQRALQKQFQQNPPFSQSQIFNLSKNNWFDHTKQQILGTIQNCQNHRYSKERKYVDMSSDPVFTDFTYEIKSRIQTQAQPKKLTLTTNVASQSFKNVQKPQLVNQNTQTIQQEILKKDQSVADKALIQKQVVEENSSTIQKEKINAKNSKKQKNQSLKLKGKKIDSRPHTVNKQKLKEQKPTFTVVRKSRVHH